MREAKQQRAELTCVWVPVQGIDGRFRMEARWIVTAATSTRPAA